VNALRSQTFAGLIPGVSDLFQSNIGLTAGGHHEFVPISAAGTFLGSIPSSDDWLENFAKRRNATKRKVYFAFRFRDVMRVNNVRQAGKIGYDEEKNPREFYDRSIWKQREITDPEGLKRLMREGVEHSSVVCVLTGSDTWESRWVKYEIARAVIDDKGLLNVHINGLSHHKTLSSHLPGLNPLEVMGIYRDANQQFYIWEKRLELADRVNVRYEWHWRRYADYVNPVSLPKYLTTPSIGYIMPLSTGALSYDFVQHVGHKNIGGWIDYAASQIGR
jgi:MTH538 TIR-like domain (DUF1863)